MKKILILTLFFLCLTAHSQTFKLGLKAGLSPIARYNIEPSNYETEIVDIALKPGFLVGAYGLVQMDENFILRSELYYRKQAYKHEYYAIMSEVDYGHVFEYDESFSLIDLPVLVQYSFKDELRTIYALAGPVFSFGFYPTTDKIYYGSNDDLIKKFNLGLQLGLGKEIKNFHFDLRYEIGLTKIPDGSTYFHSERNFSYWILSIGYQIF